MTRRALLAAVAGLATACGAAAAATLPTTPTQRQRRQPEHPEHRRRRRHLCGTPRKPRAVIVAANPDQHAIVAHGFDYDVSQGGATFSDPDGAELSYEIRGLWLGLQSVDTRIVGTPMEAGGVGLWVVAKDGRGGEMVDFFTVTIAPNA